MKKKINKDCKFYKPTIFGNCMLLSEMICFKQKCPFYKARKEVKCNANITDKRKMV